MRINKKLSKVALCFAIAITFITAGYGGGVDKGPQRDHVSGTVTFKGKPVPLHKSGKSTAQKPIVSPQEKGGWTPLFNGKNLSDVMTILGKKNPTKDPDKLIQVHDGVFHILKDAPAGKKVPYGYFGTKQDYSHYHLRLEYKWGKKKFAPRNNVVRDAGILYHMFGKLNVWPRCIECQIQERDTGDLQTVFGTRVLTTVVRKARIPKFMEVSDGGIPLTQGTEQGFRIVRKSKMVEKEGWNTVELIVRGSESVIHIVNGVVVNRAKNLMKFNNTTKKWEPLSKGKILFQVEGAEVLYRNIEIKLLDRKAAPAKKKDVSQSSSVTPKLKFQKESFAAVRKEDIRVGAAAVNFNGDDKMVIAGGILPRYARGQEGELRAVAVVIEKPSVAKVAIVQCDVLFLPRWLLDPVIVEIEKSTGIPASHILINATHTHHAPSTAAVHGYVQDKAFSKQVQNAIIKSVQNANKKLATGDATFSFYLGKEETVGANSRLLMPDKKIHWIGPTKGAIRSTGPFDSQLPVLAFHGKDQKLRALIYNHSTHTIGTRQGNVRSPSFYGLAAQELEQELGGVVSFLEGASGSTHNINRVSTDKAVNRFKKVITDAIKKAKPQKVDRLISVKRCFQFKVRTFDEDVEDNKVVTYCRKYARKGADKYILVFRNMRKKLKAQQGKKRETYLQVMVIGDVAIVGVPAEYFTSLGVDIKKRSPFKHTYIAELANDWIGYLPDRKAHQLGGYQTWMGLHSYAEVGTGEKIADEIVKMLQEIKQ